MSVNDILNLAAKTHPKDVVRTILESDDCFYILLSKQNSTEGYYNKLYKSNDIMFIIALPSELKNIKESKKIYERPM